MFKFNIGDKVIVKDSAGYSITSSGSIGYIKRQILLDDEPHYHIDWIKIPGYKSIASHWSSFEIHEKTLKLDLTVASTNPHNKKYEKIIHKIHEQYAKQSFKFKEAV